MLTIGVNEEYDEWDDEEKAVLIVQLVMLCYVWTMFCITIIGHW